MSKSNHHKHRFDDEFEYSRDFNEKEVREERRKELKREKRKKKEQFDS